MPRSGVNGTYSLPGAQATQVPGTPIPSAVNNQGWSDVEQTFNSVQPIAYGGTGVADGKPLDNTFGVKNNTDTTKIGVFNASGLPTATTRTYDLPYYSGTLGLVSDIRGQIYGLTLSNNVTDATNDIDIAAGSAVDSTGAVSIQLLSAITKRLDAAWAVGTGSGGRMSAAALADGTYYVYLIRRPDTGVVDAGFDVSATAPTLPTNYTQYRRIGAVKRVGGTILAFWQNGRYFELATPIQSFLSTANFGTAAVTRTLSGVGLAIPVRVIVRSGSASGATATRYSSLASADVAADVVNSQSVSIASYFGNAQFDIVTNTNNEIRERRNFSAADSVSSIVTIGWTDEAR